MGDGIEVRLVSIGLLSCSVNVLARVRGPSYRDIYKVSEWFNLCVE